MVVAIAMLTTQLCTFSGNATIVLWLYANANELSKLHPPAQTRYCSGNIHKILTTTTTFLLTYLQNKYYTSETEHMYVDSMSIKCYA